MTEGPRAPAVAAPLQLLRLQLAKGHSGVYGDSHASGTLPKLPFPRFTVMASLSSHPRLSRQQSPKAYRLIDPLSQPHPHLDGFYDSIEEAIRDATGWLEGLGPDAGQASIGLEVSTANGDWRTILQPVQLLCPLPIGS